MIGSSIIGWDVGLEIAGTGRDDGAPMIRVKPETVE